MLCSQVQPLLVVLFSSVLLVQVSGAARRDMLAETLRTDLSNDKDLARLLLLKFFSDAMAARRDVMLPKLGEEEEEEDEDVAVREEVMRRHLAPSQRERKAGCRNFFWKAFTSC